MNVFEIQKDKSFFCLCKSTHLFQKKHKRNFINAWFEKNVTTFYVKRGDCLASTYMC